MSDENKQEKYTINDIMERLNTITNMFEKSNEKLDYNIRQVDKNVEINKLEINTVKAEHSEKLDQDSKEKKNLKHVNWANEEIIENQFKWEEINEIPTFMEKTMQLEVVTVQESLWTPRKLEVQFKDKNSQHKIIKEHVHGYNNLINIQNLEIQNLKLQLLSRKDLPKINDELKNENYVLKIQNKLLREEIQKVNSIKLIDDKVKLLDKKVINQNSNKIIDKNKFEEFHYKSKEIIEENFLKIKEISYLTNKIKCKNFKFKEKLISNKNSKIKKVKWKHAKFHYMQISGMKKHKIKKTFKVFKVIKTTFKVNLLKRIKNQKKKKKIKTATLTPKTKFGKKKLKIPTEERASITEITLKKNVKCKMKKW